MEHIKVNLPDSEEKYAHGVGEGVWCMVDEETKRAHDENETGGGHYAILDNDSLYWHGLEHGERMPIELRGEFRPVVPYSWLLAHFEKNYSWADLDEPIYCPLCGNESPEVFEDEGGAWSVYCNFCNCNLYGYKTRAAAVKQWNHRYKAAE